MTTPERLYNLLPTVYRQRDLAQGEPLRALLAIVQQEYDAIEKDIGGLYENWFIETCQEWVVPYIGDLLGVRPIYSANPANFSERAYVANTLDYRRRKGTAAMLEQIALDVTGWPARVVEFFELLSTTQYLNHLRPDNLATISLRDANRIELLDGPFESFAHTADVRHIYDGRGRYNIPSLGIFLWRLKANLVGPLAIDPATHMLDSTKPARQSDARAVSAPPDGRYTFDPVGTTAPLFNWARTKMDTERLADEINVPGLLRRRPLYDELEAVRQSEVDGAANPTPVYFGDNPVFTVLIAGKQVPFDEIMICDIGDISATDWRRPSSTKAYTPSGGGPAIDKPITLSADPVRGRIAFPAGVSPALVQVGYTYGFSGDVGAGTYDRTAWLNDPANCAGLLTNAARWQVAVSKELPPAANLIFPTLGSAVTAWNAQPPGTQGVIAILDSRTYREDLSGVESIVIPEKSNLLIVAADWAALRETGAATTLSLDPEGLRPHLLGNIEVAGTAPAASAEPGQLFIDGLLMESTLTVLDGNLGALSLSHATLTPGGSLRVSSSTARNNDALAVNLLRSISGPVLLSASVPAFSSVDSIVTSGRSSAETDPAITAPDATLALDSTTVFGTTNARVIEASDSIFTGVVNAQLRQSGCVRFCYAPAGSMTAQRYRCQPDMALAGVVDAAAQSAIRARLTPQFTSIDFGQPGYAQLSTRCAMEISTGADDGSEMGVFRFLQQPQRMASVHTVFEEYLRFGLEGGTIDET